MQDRPFLVDAALVALVVLHWMASRQVPVLDVLHDLPDVEVGAAVSIHLGITSLAAILAGFSGVVVVFALGAPGPRFVDLRRAGGAALRLNWLWSAVSALLAAFLGLAGAVLVALHSEPARWVLEVAALLCAHAAARQLWLLWHLAVIVSANDEDERRSKAVVEPAALLARARPGRRSAAVGADQP